MMRSVSIEEDADGFAALIGSDDSQSGSSRDLFVKVDKPEKHVEGYVSYNVTTKVSGKIIYWFSSESFYFAMFYMTVRKDYYEETFCVLLVDGMKWKER